MHRFKNILLLYECDQATLERAASLAKNNRARLTILQVVRDLPEHWRRIRLGGAPVDLQALAVREYRTRLQELAAPLRKGGLRAETKVLVGHPSLEVIREVIAHRRDLVMLTAEGKGGLKERLFGSASLQLMRKCPCPVWVMKSAGGARFPRILAAVDAASTHPNGASLNETILQLATSLAAQEQAELHVIHAWTLPYENLMRGRGDFPEADIRNFARSEEARHRQALHTLLARFDAGTAVRHLVEGEAEVVIPRFTKTEKVALLVMGTVCRTGIPGFLIGNTAEKILDEVDCSVLTVKPEGFVSPVEPA